MDEIEVSVLVGWTSSRPIVPDEHMSLIVQRFPDGDLDAIERRATLLAAQWVACRPGCQMPTSTEIVALVL